MTAAFFTDWFTVARFEMLLQLQQTEEGVADRMSNLKQRRRSVRLSVCLSVSK